MVAGDMEEVMTKKPDNPFAFPVHQNDVEEGMTLRDYFAAKAMQGWMASPNRGTANMDLIAASCFAQADAMLLERERGQ